MRGMMLKTNPSHRYLWGSMICPRLVIPKGPADLDEALALHDSVGCAATLAAIEAGGVMNDHPGVGRRFAPFLKRHFGRNGRALHERIKDAFDPAHILCPGKLAVIRPSARG